MVLWFQVWNARSERKIFVNPQILTVIFKIIINVKFFWKNTLDIEDYSEKHLNYILIFLPKI